MQHIQIIKADISDVSLLQEIEIQTFIETFAKDNTPENLESYLKTSFDP